MAHPNVVINGVTYNAVPEVQIPVSGGGTATFYDTSDATAAAGDVLSGKVVYGASGRITGTITAYPVGAEYLQTKSQVSQWSTGYYQGITVQIQPTEQDKIIADNIRSGVRILGVNGSSNVVNTQITTGGATANKILTGYSAYVNGSLVNGSFTAPTVSQDSVTNALTIV